MPDELVKDEEKFLVVNVNYYKTTRICEDEGCVHLSVSSSPIFDSSGQIIGVLILAR